MNYRHVYHAGNFADCFKHALLVALIDALTRKQTPFHVLDTHAGAGHYDLDSEQARRTNEADGGIRLLLRRRPPALRRYLELVEQIGLYPGSPELIRALLRPADRLSCCELHPEEHHCLQRIFRNDAQVAVHHRSGWEAVRALLPPKQKRGLVLIDPPFEEQNEFANLVEGLLQGYQRFGHGVFAAWYPIKQPSAVRGFIADVRSGPIRDAIAIELYLRQPLDPSRLNGCGLLVINPPFQFEDQARAIVKAVVDNLADTAPEVGTAAYRIEAA